MAGTLLRLAAVAALSGCAYDWSAPDDAGGHDAAPIEDHASPPADVAPADVAPPPMDASMLDSPGTETGPPSCAQLDDRIESARSAALACDPMSPGACMNETGDECGCPVVYQAGTAGQAYLDAIASFQARSCSTAGLCSGSCGTPVEGQCLVADATAETYACAQ